MTYLISNSETADDIMRYIKSGAVEVPEWAMKLVDYAEQQRRLYNECLEYSIEEAD